MEIQSKAMVGLPVFTTTQGEKLGQVKDYIFSPEQKTVLALVIVKGKPFGEEMLLPLKNMKSMGHGAVTVVDTGALIPKEEDADLYELLKRMANIVGIRVMTTDGTLLGTVSEFRMDTASGAVTSLTLSSRFTEQLLRGKSQIGTEDIEVFGADVILAKDGAVPVTVGKNTAKTSPAEARSNTVWNQKLNVAKKRFKVRQAKERKTIFPEIKKESAVKASATPSVKEGKTSIGFKDSL